MAVTATIGYLRILLPTLHRIATSILELGRGCEVGALGATTYQFRGPGFVIRDICMLSTSFPGSEIQCEHQIGIRKYPGDMPKKLCSNGKSAIADPHRPKHKSVSRSLGRLLALDFGSRPWYVLVDAVEDSHDMPQATKYV